MNKPSCLRRNKRRPSAFTMVELLVVIAIIGVLATLIIGGGVWATEKAKVNETQGLLKTLDLAAEQFSSDNPYGRVRPYIERYSSYPPDELEVYSGTNSDSFSTFGIPGDSTVLSPVPNSEIVGINTSDPIENNRTRIQAFFLSCQLASPEAGAILDRIDPRFLEQPATINGIPTQFFDRTPGDGVFTEMDEPLSWLVDSWGNPIRYLNVRNNVNNDHRELFSIWAIRKNGNKPVFFSFGPNGEEQIKNKEMWPDANIPPTPCMDFADNGFGTTGIVDHVLNDDNIYSTDGLANKLRTP